MKKLLVFIGLLFIHFNLIAQCGVISGFQPYTNGSQGSDLWADVDLTAGWTVYEYSWEQNGNIIGTSQTISNQGYGYDDICLTVKANNQSTGDSCESSYCQLVFTIWPSINSLYIEAIPQGPLTVQFYGSVCTSYLNTNPFFEFDFGDGNTSPTNFFTHTYADTGTYLVTFNYFDGVGISETVTRKVYVDNGHVNFSVGSVSGTNTCFTANTAFTSNPPFFGGAASSVNYYSPLCTLCSAAAPWGTSFPMDYYGTGIDIIQYYATDSLGNDIRTCRMVAIPDCKVAPDTMSGTVWLDADADGLWDAGETAYNGAGKVKLNIGNYEADPDSAGNYSLPVPQTPSYVDIGSLPPGFITTYPSSNGHISSFSTSTNHPGYNFGVVDKGVNICGRVFIDIDLDGVYTFGTDLDYSNITVSAFNIALNETFAVSTSQNGYYCINVPVGNYIVKAVSVNLDSAFAVPDSIVINAPAAGTFSNNDIGFQTPVQGGNLGIFLYAGGMPRPGFNYSLNSSVINSGVDNSGGTVVLNYSPTLIYVNSSPSGMHNAINKTVTWQTGLMVPTSSKFYSANFTVPIPTPLGTVLGSNATVTTDVTYTDYDLTNNSSTRTSIVVGSYDPNDKLVAPRGVGANGNVLHTQRLYYRINFQNTGTAEAINIIVQDEIDPNLDMSTFRMERASHTYSMVITNNTITWRFFNINLPDSNSNEPQSHGYIEFSIKPEQGLPDGTVISNGADIYFDFNPPIVTNVVSNTLQTSLTGIEETETDSRFIVYPNPFRDEILIKQINQDEKVKAITITDVYGKVFFTSDHHKIIDDVISIKLPEISSGVYFIKLESDSGISVSKLVKH